MVDEQRSDHRAGDAEQNTSAMMLALLAAGSTCICHHAPPVVDDPVGVVVELDAPPGVVVELVVGVGVTGVVPAAAAGAAFVNIRPVIDTLKVTP